MWLKCKVIKKVAAPPFSGLSPLSSKKCWTPTNDSIFEGPPPLPLIRGGGGRDSNYEIGCDHGGGSFKLSYQIANVSHPNSTNNTVVLSIFEAKDYRSNVKIGLTRFQEQINALQTMTWWWVIQYDMLSLILGEINYQKKPTSNTWMLVNL